ncbi:MAG: MoaD/ThiS family protein [Candidatus Poribacteria bacterium]|nr:MoaD/ThiS family protein [Candidatus Poribacteria bacterium]MDE0504482.1 MoaD/ThiS family protein [Candidatus Poribacteria bacterium]
MATVAIPSLMQELTDGKEKATVKGSTIREVLNNLESIYPGFKARICDDDQIRPNIAVYVDGALTREGMRQQISEDSEVHFLPAISGGSSPEHS